MRALPFLVAILLGAGCSSEDISFRIPAGKHNGKPKNLTHLEIDGHFDRDMTFDVWFHTDTEYATVDPVNQHDWNKVMGFTTTGIHENSLRLGWRYEPDTDQIELGYYGYLNGTRTSHQLTSVDFETWIPIEIEMWTTGMAVTADGEIYELHEAIDMTFVIDDSTWALETIYFGGDETAPHEMHVDVRDIWVD